jgi:hypothetical protein
MKYFLVFSICIVTSSCYGQAKSSNFLEMYISKPSKFTFSKNDFLKEKTIKLTSDTFRIIQCTVYFSDCGDIKDNIQEVTTTSIFNNLKDSSFVYLLNKRKLPISITFDNVIVENKSHTLRRQIDGISIIIN